MSKEQEKTRNPLADLIDDTTYVKLQEFGLFNEKAVRDYRIRKMYRELRASMNAGDAIDAIRERYPYLQFDTVRKIVYAVPK